MVRLAASERCRALATCPLPLTLLPLTLLALTPLPLKRLPLTSPDGRVRFAALGSYQSNPWLLHLVYKILIGSSGGGSGGGGSGGGARNSTAALTLLDLDAYPFPTAPPARVRATLYHYDFTRVHSPWAVRQQAPMLPANCSLLRPRVGGPRVGDRGLADTGCEAWWKRTRVREYLPPVDRSLMEEQVVRAQGWPVGGARAPSDPCRAAKPTREATIPRGVCEAVLTLRGMLPRSSSDP